VKKREGRKEKREKGDSNHLLGGLSGVREEKIFNFKSGGLSGGRENGDPNHKSSGLSGTKEKWLTPCSWVMLILLFFAMASVLDAQVYEQRYTRRIVWRGGENALRYAVEIERSENGIFRNYIRESTTSLFLEVSLQLGQYRFRITPYDILDRPGEGTQWRHFEITYVPPGGTAPSPILEAPQPRINDPPPASTVRNEQQGIINNSQTGTPSPDRTPAPTALPERTPTPAATPGPTPAPAATSAPVTATAPTAHPEQAPASAAIIEQESGIEESTTGHTVRAEDETPDTRESRFNTLGISAGSSFTDPLIIAAIHGSYSPMRHLFIELGCDVGVLSKYEDVESFYCIYPFAHLGFFWPFQSKGGFFIGAGGGYMLGNYTFSYGKAELKIWGADLTTGINLFNTFNICYTLKTNFSSASHKVAVGYVYRFK